MQVAIELGLVKGARNAELNEGKVVAQFPEGTKLSTSQVLYSQAYNARHIKINKSSGFLGMKVTTLKEFNIDEDVEVVNRKDKLGNFAKYEIVLKDGTSIPVTCDIKRVFSGNTPVVVFPANAFEDCFGSLIK